MSRRPVTQSVVFVMMNRLRGGAGRLFLRVLAGVLLGVGAVSAAVPGAGGGPTTGSPVPTAGQVPAAQDSVRTEGRGHSDTRMDMGLRIHADGRMRTDARMPADARRRADSQDRMDGQARLDDRAQAGDRALKDDRGMTVTLPARVRRVVSLSPALTESVCVLQACDRLMGVDRFSNWPAQVATLPKLGSLGSFNVESVAALQPDVVLMASGGVVADRLQKLGVAVLVLSPRRQADVAPLLQRLARVLDLPQARADAVWAGIRTQLDAVAASMPPAARGWRVWLEVDPAPWVATPSSLLGETLAGLGLANVISGAEMTAGEQAGKDARRDGRAKGGTDAGTPDGEGHAGASGGSPGSHTMPAYLQVSREWALQVQPDVLMISDPQQQGLAAVRARPGWQRLKALQQGRVCLFGGDALDVLVRPGPRLAEGAQQMRDCVVRLLKRR